MIKIEITDLQGMDSYTLKETGLYLLSLSERDDPPFAEYCRSVKPPETRIQSVEEKLNIDKPAEYSPPEEPETPEPHEPPNAAEIFAALKTVREDTEISDVFNDIHKKVIETTNENIVPPAPEHFEVLVTTESGIGVYAEENYRYGVEIDTGGLPWDSRIHTRTKTKTADGHWKKQRGVGGNVVKKIEEELRAAHGIPSPVVLTPVAPAPQVTAVPSVAPEPHVVLTPPPPPPFPNQEKAPDFADLMTIVTAAITAGRLTRDQVVDVLEPYGIPSLPVVATRPDLIPGIVHALQGVINAPC